MTDYRLSQLPATLAVPAAGDLLAIVDISDKSTAPAGAGGSTKKIPAGNLLQSAEAAFARAMGFGHSYLTGFGNLEGAEWWLARFCAATGAEEVNYGVTSSVLAADNGLGHPGGYANVINALTPRLASGALYTARTSPPFVPLSPLVLFNFGFNDLAYITATTATNVAWFKMALRACVCVGRAGGYFADTDASVAYSSGWTANTGQEASGSPTSHSATATGKTITISVPSTFPGGEIDLLTHALSGGTKWSTVVDSGSAQVLDGTSSAFGAGSGRSNLVVQRLTGLSSGAHTIVMTVSALDGGASAVFDSWLIAAPSGRLPLTVLVNQPAAPCLPLTVSGAHTPITSSDVTALNTAISALTSEFTDGLVILADIASYFSAAGGNVANGTAGSLYCSDNLHPDTNGHALIAQCARDAVRGAPSPGWGRFASPGLLMRQVNGPLEPQLAANWSIGGSPLTAYFAKPPGGRVELNMTLARSSAPAIGETIVTLPAYCSPEAEKMLFALSYDAAFDTATPGIVGIRANGDLVWYAGDPTTLIQIFGSYYAGAPGA